MSNFNQVIKSNPFDSNLTYRNDYPAWNITDKVKPIKHDYVYFRLKRPFESKSTYDEDFQKHGKFPPVKPFRPDKNVLETAREFDDRTVYRDEFIHYRYPSINYKKYSKESFHKNNEPSSRYGSSSSTKLISNNDLKIKHQQNQKQYDQNLSYKILNDEENSSNSFLLKQFGPRNQNKPKRTLIPAGPKTRLPFDSVSLYKADYTDFSNPRKLSHPSSFW